MRDKIILVVGDKFAKFSAGKDVITVTQLCSLLSLPNIIAFQSARTVFAPGQGLSDADIDTVLALAAKSEHADIFDLTLWKHQPRRANGAHTHKHKPENTLISAPRRLGEDRFRLDILIDQNCELMADHQSGQHLQGMVLLEAARQSLLAVTEAYFLPQDGPKFSFVFNELSIRYARFAFPLGARMTYIIREKEIAAGRRLRFVVDITIEQCGSDVAAFSAEFTAFEESRIARQEDRQARDMLGSHLGHLSQVDDHSTLTLPLAA